MKFRILLALVGTVLLSPVHANEGFSPTAAGCKGVAKELKRVSDEMSATKSSIQREWLKRQHDALKSKRDTCRASGLSVD
ncbi:hypothetical protein [Alteromonas sp. CYL-A6]|uniref:hypothetical protein n=1 Tax=Alteromonas nitratireducens TaxID=3390813 RepID=UPI0034BDE342